MRQKSVHPESASERIVKTIRRATRKRHSSEEKIRIVLDGLRGESSIAELCRREGIAEGLYYAWSKEFLEAGKRRLADDRRRAERPHAPIGLCAGVLGTSGADNSCQRLPGGKPRSTP
jgi:transposase